LEKIASNIYVYIKFFSYVLFISNIIQMFITDETESDFLNLKKAHLLGFSCWNRWCLIGFAKFRQPFVILE